jgi:hypothetical protein
MSDFLIAGLPMIGLPWLRLPSICFPKSGFLMLDFLGVRSPSEWSNHDRFSSVRCPYVGFLYGKFYKRMVSSDPYSRLS